MEIGNVVKKLTLGDYFADNKLFHKLLHVFEWLCIIVCLVYIIRTYYLSEEQLEVVKQASAEQVRIANAELEVTKTESAERTKAVKDEAARRTEIAKEETQKRLQIVETESAKRKSLDQAMHDQYMTNAERYSRQLTADSIETDLKIKELQKNAGRK